MSTTVLLKNWNVEEATGYKPMTTFYMDFSIADTFGKKAIENTYARIMESWKDNYKFLTELVLVLSWKSCEHYESGNNTFSELYSNLYYIADEYALDHLHGEEFDYFFEITD